MNPLNCTLPKQLLPLSSAKMLTLMATARRWWYSSLLNVCEGATTMDSPVWMPMGSRFSMLHTTRQLSLESRLRYRQQMVGRVGPRTASCWGTHMTSYSNSFHPLRHSSMITWSPNGHEPDRKPPTGSTISYVISCGGMARCSGILLTSVDKVNGMLSISSTQFNRNMCYAFMDKHWCQSVNLFKLAIKNTPTPIQFSTAWLANIRILVLELSPINNWLYNTGMSQKLDAPKKNDGEKTRNRLLNHI